MPCSGYGRTRRVSHSTSRIGDAIGHRSSQRQEDEQEPSSGSVIGHQRHGGTPVTARSRFGRRVGPGHRAWHDYGWVPRAGGPVEGSSFREIGGVRPEDAAAFNSPILDDSWRSSSLGSTVGRPWIERPRSRLLRAINWQFGDTAAPVPTAPLHRPLLSTSVGAEQPRSDARRSRMDLAVSFPRQAVSWGR